MGINWKFAKLQELEAVILKCHYFVIVCDIIPACNYKTAVLKQIVTEHHDYCLFWYLHN